MKSALDALREAQRAQQEYDRRMDVQLSLTDEDFPVRFESASGQCDRGDSDVAALDAKANTTLQGGSGLKPNFPAPHQESANGAS